MLIIRRVSQQQRRMEVVFFPLETGMKKKYCCLHVTYREEQISDFCLSSPPSLSLRSWLPLPVFFFLHPSSCNTARNYCFNTAAVTLRSNTLATSSPFKKPLQEDCQVPPVISRRSVVTFLVNRGRQDPLLSPASVKR